jgi:hypothetical protein
MALRRTRSDDLIGPFAQLAGLIVLLSLFSPQVRQIVFAIGFVVICVLGLAVVGLVGFGACRLATRSDKSEVLESRVAPELPPPVVVVAPGKERSTPRTSSSLIEQLRTIDWFQFERLVGLLYRKQGYGVTRRGGANPDGGIDLVIEKDGQRTAVQCKQWKTWNVGVKAVREFLGALTDAGIRKGIFVTLCGYTGEAKQLADKHGIEIMNEVGLAKMLQSTNAMSDPETLAILNDTRKLCPKCERRMEIKTARKGRGAGQMFWGCSGYPRCRFTMPIRSEKQFTE